MDFAVNKVKLQRAIEQTTIENGGKPADESVVKAKYLSFGGLLIEEEEEKTELPRKLMKAPAFKGKSKKK